MSDDDHTLDASPEQLEALRRAALGDHTVEADESTLAHLQDLARAAELTDRVRHGPLGEATELRRPQVPAHVEPWRPPARSMRPAQPRAEGPQHTHPVWRWIALALAAILVALVLWLALSGGDGDDRPEQPGSTTVPVDGVVSTGVVGGAGGD